jgi:large conductance mechanosensitive channel
MKSLGQEFKEFILRGNVVSLAVAVIIGTAFTAVVTAMSEFIIMPIIAAFGGQPDFSSIGFEINGSFIGIGAFINAIIAFLIIALIVFFMIVKPMNALMERSRKEPPADPTLKDCPYCLNAVPIAATRCGHCTSDLTGTAA